MSFQLPKRQILQITDRECFMLILDKILEQNIKGLMAEYLIEEAVATWIQYGLPRNKSLENNPKLCGYVMWLPKLVIPYSRGIVDLVDSVYPDVKSKD